MSAGTDNQLITGNTIFGQKSVVRLLGLINGNCIYELTEVTSMLMSLCWRAPVAYWIGELTLNPLGFSPLWFKPRSGHMWESQVLLTNGQVVFPWVLRFSPTFDERSAGYK